MIPILFSPVEKYFQNNGIGRLTECIRCVVTEERNGIYECEFDYPINGKWYDYILNNRCFIGVIHDDHHDVQPFEIYSFTAPINGIVTFYAHHISYNLSRVIVNDIEADTCAEAFIQLKSKSLTHNDFTFWTDKPTSGTFEVTVPDDVRSLLGGKSGSILDIYGSGEYEFDKYEVKLHAHRGLNRGVTIRYGKNMTDLNRDLDGSDVFNTVFPFWKSADGEIIVTLPEKYIASINDAIKYPWENETNGNIMQDGDGHDIEFYHYVMKARPLDLSAEFQEAPTEAELRSKATSYLEKNKPWLPVNNITVDFVQLWESEDYKDVAALQRVSLCDTVAIYYPELGVTDAEAKVIKISYNVLTEEYDSMELGEAKSNFSDALKLSMHDDIAEIAGAEASSVAAEAVAYATQKITGGLGGYVVMNLNADGQPQEILIMDTDNMMTAVNVIRMNKNGIGFSMNGYEGPFLSAWTIDGHFNADFITAGTMLANRIHGGTLTVGGIDNQAGVFQVLDRDEEVAVRGDKDGLFTRSLTAQNYINFEGNNGSYFRMPWHSEYPYDEDGHFQVDRYGMEIVQGETTCTLGYQKPYERDGLIFYPTETTFIIEAEAGEEYEVGCEVYITPAMIQKTAYGLGMLKILSDANLGQVILIYGKDESPYDENPTPVYITHEQSIFNEVAVRDALVVSGNLTVSGNKNRIVKTKEYGDRLLYCYETPSPFFGDVGEGVIDDTGFCYVFLDAVFAETISTNQYQVFLQKYGQGDLWVAERKSGYFVVQGTAGLSFGWELKAKQGDFSENRLERYEDPQEKPKSIDYGIEAVKYLRNLEEGRMTA